jgi:hypothetical protein
MPISIPASAIEVFQRNGVTIETHDTAALCFVVSDLLSGSLNATMLYGTPASNSFAKGPTAGPQTAPITITINLTSGVWNSSNGLSGTLLSATLTALNTNQKNIRNAIESIVNANSVIPGSVVAWT